MFFMVKRGLTIFMIILFIVTSILFFLGLTYEMINVKYAALYLGWFVYFGIYILIIFLEKKHVEKAMEEVKKPKTK